MRERMDPFPGKDWPVVAEEAEYSTGYRGWWKLAALEDWLNRQPGVRSLAWCDDHLRGGRPAAVRRRLRARQIDPLLLAPATGVGLTPAHADRLEAWLRS